MHFSPTAAAENRKSEKLRGARKEAYLAFFTFYICANIKI
jgi:hypothetical protein